MRRLPPLNSLRVFDAAARHGSFNRASEELCVTPSAVSHQLKSLEEFLGVELFKREKRTISLTAAGERYLPSVQLALDELEQATRRLISSPNSNVVKVSIAPAFLTRWLVPRISRFQERHPEVELRVESSIDYIDFDNSDTDIAVYYGKGHWTGVEAHFMRNIFLTPVVSPNLIQTDGPITNPSDILRYPLIHVSGRSHEWTKLLQDNGISISQVSKTISFSSTALAVSAAAAGAGIALADVALLKHEVESERLVAPFDIRLDSHNAFYLVYKENRTLTPAMMAFRDWILEEMQADVDAASSRIG
ncbi:transcriptional regulator GcvA [Marinobacterium sp. LSUCC0821]|jgi:LysR family glycine cleavage system transcriptional activator|uniref:transcriptional regulator GcvA n=1 Tax=Marinobacterium sp. LSUCC0821 TaxID=2668067 RepID=UPI00145235E8|nr:transcriptional regulator GcvA [Marinobacterium sp. LSUCC0821]QJD71057.1 transcriptional regulator GcvA [Marinobacterium sp. LSUCC0821]